MALPKNRPAVQALMKELEPRILGREREGFTCGCGAVKCGATIADNIMPGGDNYPGQEVSWPIWSVRMRTHETSSWSCGLSEFIDRDELDAMFKRYFGEPAVFVEMYRPDVSGYDRVSMDLPAAVRIQENDSQIRFSFDWGREQYTSEEIYDLYRMNGHEFPVNSEAYIRVVALLEAIEPEVYLGGPDPELPYESTWHLDYVGSLQRAAVESNYMFFQGFTTSHIGDIDAHTETAVIFAKYTFK